MDAIKEVPISSPHSLYIRAQNLARQQNRSVNEMLIAVLDESLPQVDGSVKNDEERKIDREMNAYIKMHPKLKEKYLGQHIAIHNEQLIDVDEDYGNLLSRIRLRFPDEFIWLATVERDAMPTVHFRSPRLSDE